jgi:hypothetical protein
MTETFTDERQFICTYMIRDGQGKYKRKHNERITDNECLICWKNINDGHVAGRPTCVVANRKQIAITL